LARSDTRDMPDPRDTAAGEGGGRALRGTNQSGMRANNEKLILTLLRRHGALAKSELSRLTGLTAQTISVIVRGLERDGLVLRGEPQRGRIGQPSIPMTLNPDGVFFVGLKIGRRSADLVLMDFTGDTRASLRESYPYPEADKVLAFAARGVAELIGTLDGAARDRVAGIGVALPFKLWQWHEALGAPAAARDRWIDFDLRGQIEAQTDLPVHMLNDATAACTAELLLGDHSERQSFIYFYVGTFIGGGIVLNGSVYAGPSGNAGAMGSMPVPDAHGHSVQLIDQSSIVVLEQMLRRDGLDPAHLWHNPDDWSAVETHVADWIEIVGRGLAYAAVASIAIIDFEAIVLDGAMPAEVRARLVAATRRALDEIDLEGLDVPPLQEGGIGSMARAMGAASLPLFARFLLSQSPDESEAA